MGHERAGIQSFQKCQETAIPQAHTAAAASLICLLREHITLIYSFFVKSGHISLGIL